MDPFNRLLRELSRRITALEDTRPRLRTGVVTDTSPLSVALGGADIPFTDLRAIDGQTFTLGDTVACLVWKGDMLVLGVIA
jgi:hypothetical protein